MYRIYIAIIMAVMSIVATPKQGNPLPDGTLTITARGLDWQCDHIVLIPYVDRGGMYYTHSVVDGCYFIGGYQATSRLTFTGVPGYVVQIEMYEVSSLDREIPGTRRMIPGWWWTGSSLPPNSPYPAPQEQP